MKTKRKGNGSHSVAAISFFSPSIKFNINSKSAVRKWILSVIKKEKYSAGEINYIFCNDVQLLKINRKYLQHDFLTDIITFPLLPPHLPHSPALRQIGREITGDIYISVPRIKENAKKFNVSFENELLRVMIHGILHLCGYNDNTVKEKRIMRKMENNYLHVTGI